MSIFPVEVCDLIIDQIPVFKKWKGVIPLNRELVSCAMVSRSWARRSRSRQFNSLHFTTRSSCNRLSPFLDLISSPHTTIAQHVLRIILVFGDAGGDSIPTPVFMRIACLHALESITLTRYDSIANDLPRVEEIAAWLGLFTNLRRMELSHFYLDSFNQLRDMVCACRGLESLSFYHNLERRVSRCLILGFARPWRC
ncbi:hypothetical protein FIBSPDRAFT_424738 [Athelia psychrophila]|uniref:F-box domain-containing protein n=1 Tax=Athelia psychrophila TaxID=1759441 RepID=A0A167UPZ6_9AGAM|nr:hypothetical protein FIBSPDRAFT_424738 [Fibularhizoctonia sp. CBS 109695]